MGRMGRMCRMGRIHRMSRMRVFSRPGHNADTDRSKGFILYILPIPTILIQTVFMARIQTETRRTHDERRGPESRAR